MDKSCRGRRSDEGPPLRSFLRTRRAVAVSRDGSVLGAAAEVSAEFHNNLAAEIQGYLNQRVRPRYVARQVPVTTYNSIAITPTRLIKPTSSLAGPSGREDSRPEPRRSFLPQRRRRRAAGSIELFSVEVRAAGTRELVTAIEILSPVNRCPGHEASGLPAEAARAAPFGREPAGDRPAPHRRAAAGGASSACRSLLRGPKPGQRPAAGARWAVRISSPGGAGPPARSGPNTSPLDLQEVAARAYERGGYDTEIDYLVMPAPPSNPRSGVDRERLGLMPSAA